jgi:hypothetical protein
MLNSPAGTTIISGHFSHSLKASFGFRLHSSAADSGFGKADGEIAETLLQGAADTSLDIAKLVRAMCASRSKISLAIKSVTPPTISGTTSAGTKRSGVPGTFFKTFWTCGQELSLPTPNAKGACPRAVGGKAIVETAARTAKSLCSAANQLDGVVQHGFVGEFILERDITPPMKRDIISRRPAGM